MLMMPTTRQMHETTAVFNTHGVVVQRMIDKVMINTNDSNPHYHDDDNDNHSYYHQNIERLERTFFGHST